MPFEQLLNHPMFFFSYVKKLSQQLYDSKDGFFKRWNFIEGINEVLFVLIENESNDECFPFVAFGPVFRQYGQPYSKADASFIVNDEVFKLLHCLCF